MIRALIRFFSANLYCIFWLNFWSSRLQRITTLVFVYAIDDDRIVALINQSIAGYASRQHLQPVKVADRQVV